MAFRLFVLTKWRIVEGLHYMIKKYTSLNQGEQNKEINGHNVIIVRNDNGN